MKKSQEESKKKQVVIAPIAKPKPPIQLRGSFTKEVI